jgi:hypothetical protein
MLKVAIADKSFFGKKTHPARLLLDTFGEVAVRLATDFNPDSTTYVHLEAIVQHLVNTFQDDVGVFERAREQLNEVIAEHDKQVEAATLATSERIEQTENLSAAKTAAQDEVRVRVRAHNLPNPCSTSWSSSGSSTFSWCTRNPGARVRSGRTRSK